MFVSRSVLERTNKNFLDRFGQEVLVFKLRAARADVLYRQEVRQYDGPFTLRAVVEEAEQIEVRGPAGEQSVREISVGTTPAALMSAFSEFSVDMENAIHLGDEFEWSGIRWRVAEVRRNANDGGGPIFVTFHARSAIGRKLKDGVI